MSLHVTGTANKGGGLRGHNTLLVYMCCNVEQRHGLEKRNLGTLYSSVVPRHSLSVPESTGTSRRQLVLPVHFSRVSLKDARPFKAPAKPVPAAPPICATRYTISSKYRAPSFVSPFRVPATEFKTAPMSAPRYSTIKRCQQPSHHLQTSTPRRYQYHPVLTATAFVATPRFSPHQTVFTYHRAHIPSSSRKQL